MIKSLIFTGIVAGTLTYNVTDAYELTRQSVQKVVNVYSAAASIRPHENRRFGQRQSTEALMSAAQGLAPLAELALRTENPSFDTGQKIFDGYRLSMDSY